MIRLAIQDHMRPGGISRSEASRKYGVSTSTLIRRLRIHGIKLSPEELKLRQKKNGAQTINRPRSLANLELGRKRERKNGGSFNQGQKVEIILGRKNCTRCGRWRYINDFHVRERDFQTNEPISFQSNCKSCQRQIARVSKGLKERGKPYGVRKRKMTHEERLEHRRNLYREHSKDPKFVENRREYARIYAEAKRREAGIERRNFNNKSLAGYGEMLPVEPMIHWIETKLNNGYQGNASLLAVKCGVDERVIRRLREEQELVGEDLVDRMLVEEGSTDLWEVYPHLYA